MATADTKHTILCQAPAAPSNGQRWSLPLRVAASKCDYRLQESSESCQLLAARLELGARAQANPPTRDQSLHRHTSSRTQRLSQLQTQHTCTATDRTTQLQNDTAAKDKFKKKPTVQQTRYVRNLRTSTHKNANKLCPQKSRCGPFQILGSSTSDPINATRRAHLHPNKRVKNEGIDLPAVIVVDPLTPFAQLTAQNVCLVQVFPWALNPVPIFRHL